MTRTLCVIGLVVSLGLGACAEREPPPDVEDTVFDEQVRGLERAREVQDITDEQEKRLREAVEASEGGG